MKKLLFLFVMMLGLGLSSCGGHSETTTEVIDTPEVVTDSVMPVDTLVVDTVAVDSVM